MNMLLHFQKIKETYNLKLEAIHRIIKNTKIFLRLKLVRRRNKKFYRMQIQLL